MRRLIVVVLAAVALVAALAVTAFADGDTQSGPPAMGWFGGDAGPQGPAGPTGPSGLTGQRGARGYRGPAGRTDPRMARFLREYGHTAPQLEQWRIISQHDRQIGGLDDRMNDADNRLDSAEAGIEAGKQGQKKNGNLIAAIFLVIVPLAIFFGVQVLRRPQ